MRVCVTGAAGHLARALLPELCAASWVQSVIGVDRVSPVFRHSKFVPVVCDVADPEALAAAARADALVHLAYIVLRGRASRDEMRRVNVTAAQAMIGAATAGRVVVLSSAAVYGSGEGVTEHAPIAPLSGFLYAENKAELERWIAMHAVQAAVLRPHIILGPHALPLLRQLAAMPVYPRVPDPQPRLQCVHETDVARAILAALRSDASGAFNLAWSEPFVWRSLARSSHRRTIGLPLSWLRAALWLAWRVGGWGGEPGWLAGAAHSLTLDCTRARDELGWTALHDPLSSAAEQRGVNAGRAEPRA
jgi:nucleoside-diphosphate-sugar epimerase